MSIPTSPGGTSSSALATPILPMDAVMRLNDISFRPTKNSFGIPISVAPCPSSPSAIITPVDPCRPLLTLIDPVACNPIASRCSL
jgi:hypothetical protein